MQLYLQYWGNGHAKQPSADELVKKMHIYTMEYYSAVNKNEIIKIPDKWMDIENIILGDKTQTQKDKYPVFFLISGS